jgi:hypothetical protein
MSRLTRITKYMAKAYYKKTMMPLKPMLKKVEKKTFMPPEPGKPEGPNARSKPGNVPTVWENKWQQHLNPKRFSKNK